MIYFPFVFFHPRATIKKDKAPGGYRTLATDTTSIAAPLPKTVMGYEVVDRIGEGAASIVYVVNDAKTRQLYALKHVVRKDEKSDRQFAQLQNEFDCTRLFRHPVLRKVHDLKVSRSIFRKITEAALLMELVDGIPLDRQRPTDVPAVIRCFLEVANGLGAMHYLQYIHCDLKPGNILLNASDGAVRLIDFGQTVKVGTIKERIQGTPDFIAPEQVKLKPVDERTDVFNFGATLYWALTGRRMPTLFTVEKKDRELLNEQRFSTPHDLNPEVPEVVSRLVMECVKMLPNQRPREMGWVAERLGKALATMS